MKQLLMVALAVLLALAAPAEAKKSKSGGGSYRPKTVSVRSYTTKKGTHVNSHKRSSPRR